MKNKVLVLGGDGFCGWPTSLHLSKNGYDIAIVDNFSRRKIDIDLGVQSLTPIMPMEHRIATWKACTGDFISFYNIDIATQYEKLLSLIKEFQPSSIIHFAEQRSAPFSMKNAECKRYTIQNNICGTHNLLCAIVESKLDIHLLHLGSMGVYGYDGDSVQIPEGYINAYFQSSMDTLVERQIMYPPNPGSVYHTTKVQDSLLFYYYNKNDKLRITDLHQGIVWGTSTEETRIHESLINRFDFDGDYGTVLNRFLVQSVLGHPLTVHGAGGQTRAFIHLQNTVECIRLALENPPALGEKVKIFNQAVEVHTVLELAQLIAQLTGSEIRHYIDPRNEAETNTLNMTAASFLRMGLRPIALKEELLSEVRETVKKYVHRCNLEKIICTSLWTSDKSIDKVGQLTLNAGEKA